MCARILVQYVRAAADLLRRYRADAAINGLMFERAREDDTVLAFADALRIACDRYAGPARGAPAMPSWDSVMAAIPEFGALLHQAVDEDSRPIALSTTSTTSTMSRLSRLSSGAA
jgi:glucosyl-3-phosphoglycerate synthase